MQDLVLEKTYNFSVLLCVLDRVFDIFYASVLRVKNWKKNEKISHI